MAGSNASESIILTFACCATQFFDFTKKGPTTIGPNITTSPPAKKNHRIYFTILFIKDNLVRTGYVTLRGAFFATLSSALVDTLLYLLNFSRV